MTLRRFVLSLSQEVAAHSYATQKNILKKGIEARANVIVDQIHSDDTSTNPPFAFYRNQITPVATTSLYTMNAR